MNQASLNIRWLIKPELIFLLVVVLLLISNDTTAQTIYSDCVTCHNVSAPPNTGKLNISSMNFSSSAFHRNLTEGISNITPISDNVVKTCWACHWNGTDPNATHPNKTAYTPWLCYDCHTNTTGGIDTSLNLGNYSATAVYSHIPQNAMGNYTSVSQTNITTSVQCWICHNNSVLNANDSSGAPENNTIEANVSHYGITRFLVNSTGQNCTYCHVQDNDAIRAIWGTNISLFAWPNSNTTFVGLLRHETNESHCDNCHGNLSISNSLHSDQLKSVVSVHYAFDWEGDNNLDNGISYWPNSDREESCFACHDGGMQFKPANSTTLKFCEDCHMPVGTGPWTFWDNVGPNPNMDYRLRSDLSGWNESNRTALGIPIIYSHVPYNVIQNSTTGLNVSRNLSGENGELGMKKPSSCSSWNNATQEGTCHGVAYSARLRATPPEDISQGKEYFMHYQERDPLASSNPNVSAPYMNTYIQDYAPNTTNCLWCHNQSNVSIRSYWGNATLIYYNRSNQSQYIGPELMYGATNLSECYFCHANNQNAPVNFHAATLEPGRACHNCHFNYTIMQGEFSEPGKWLNETLFRNSVHGNFSFIYCTNCHTMTEGHPPPEARWRWCEDCHVVMPQDSQGIPQINVQQRHNLTFKPQFSYVNDSGTIKSVVNVTDCTLCHNSTIYNQARATFNRSSGRDCRFCHNFPDLNPDSPF